MGNTETREHNTGEIPVTITFIESPKRVNNRLNPLENDIKADSPTTERFKPFPYRSDPMGLLLPEVALHCRYCTSIEIPKNRIPSGAISFHVPRAIFITHLSNLIRVNYPGYIQCKFCHKYSSARYIEYDEGCYTLTAAALSGNISYVKLENDYTNLYSEEIHYYREAGSIFITLDPIEAVYLPTVAVSSKQSEGSYYVLELETGGAIGFFRDENKKMVVLDDLGNVVPSVDMDKTAVDDNIFIFTDGKMQVVIKKKGNAYNFVSIKRLKNNIQTKPANRTF